MTTKKTLAIVVTISAALVLSVSLAPAAFAQPVPITPVPATFGAELAPTIVAANWTCGAGWDCSVAGTLNKNGDGTGTAAPTTALKIAAKTVYKVVITTGAVTVGNGATYTLGGTAGTALTAASTYTDYITTATTANLIITPTPTTTRFTITAVSVTPVIGGLPTYYTSNVSATATNSVVSFGKTCYSVRIKNDGANTVYYEYPGSVATTSSVKLLSGESEVISIPEGHAGLWQLGLICAAAETATVRVHAMCW